MNRKYIDFVPTSKVTNGARGVTVPRRRVVSEVREEGVIMAMPDGTSVSRTRVFRAVNTGGAKLVAPEPIIDHSEKSDYLLEEPEYNSLVADAKEKGVSRTENLGGFDSSEIPSNNFSIRGGLRLGVVEDYDPKFVNKDVPKRPLHTDSQRYTTILEASGAASQQEDINAIKSKKIKRTGFLGRKKKANVESSPEENSKKKIRLSANPVLTSEDEAAISDDVAGNASFGVKPRNVGGSILGSSTTLASKDHVAKSVKVDNKIAKKSSVGIAPKQDTGVAPKGAPKMVSKSGAGTTFVPPRSPFINQEKIVKRPLSAKNVYQRNTVSLKEEPKGPVTIIAKQEKDSKMGLLVTIILTIVLGAAAGTVAFLLLPK